MIESRGFYRPIVTPFELQRACVSSKEWAADRCVMGPSKPCGDGGCAVVVVVVERGGFIGSSTMRW